MRALCPARVHGAVRNGAMAKGVAGKVSLSRAASGTVTVDYATADGYRSARAGEDYTAVSGTLTFASGEKAANSTRVLI